MKIGILNGGGDCAGLNAVIAAIVKAGIEKGHQFVGIKYGFEGLLGEPRTMDLDLRAIRGISHLGGTILYTTNRGRFTAKVGEGNIAEIPAEILAEAKANYDRLGLECLVVIGGDGTLSGALQFSKTGAKIVGVPKTIDNDLSATDQTFGFSSAVDVIAESLDRIHTTAVSHGRVMVVETMGRNSGWLAMYGGLAGGADVILLPEMPFSFQRLADFLEYRHNNGRNYSIIAVAEGAHSEDGERVYQKVEGARESLLGGISANIVHVLSGMLDKERFELRNVVLGHLQRGGTPNAEDRILAQRFGIAAMQTIERGGFGEMVRLDGTEIATVSIAEAVGKIKVVEPVSDIVRTARELGVFLG